MRRKLYGNTISPSCEVCVHGRISADKKAVLCEKRGVVPLYHHCRSYDYDPLRRIPKRPPAMKRYTEDDFSIDG